MPSISKITFNGNTLIDLTGDTVTAKNLLYSARLSICGSDLHNGDDAI